MDQPEIVEAAPVAEKSLWEVKEERLRAEGRWEAYLEAQARLAAEATAQKTLGDQATFSQPVLIVETAAENEVRLKAEGRWEAHLEAKAKRKAEEAALAAAVSDLREPPTAAGICTPGSGPEAVEGAGCDPAEVGSSPTAPTMSEQEKYEKMWQFEQYRAVAPGEDVAQIFLQTAKPPHDAEIIDFGCGTGRGALALALFGGLRVQMLDFTSNSLDEDIRNATVSQPERMKFAQHDLTKPVPYTAEYGYCTDVMEHIPPEDVDNVLRNVLQAAQHVFFQISTVDDVCGKLIGAPLHLSVHPYEWWLQKLQALGCVVHWSKEFPNAALFYVSAWISGKEIVQHGELNIAEQAIVDNVRKNVLGDWVWVEPHETNDMEVMILGGGPSLQGQLETIRQLRTEGVKLVTLNGTYNWAIANGLSPSAQVVVDARAHNARFVTPVVDKCKYLISSQCHPDVLANLPKERTYLWHTCMDSVQEVIKTARPKYWQIPGGSTVMLRAIPLLRLLGFKKFHLFGFDSCLVDEQHHSYVQPENDEMPVKPVNVGGRMFQCHPWMVSQAQEFMDLVTFLGHEIELEIYGDGLIKHIVQTGAKLADEDDFLQ